MEMLVLCLCLITTARGIEENPYIRITPFQKSTGIFFELMPNVQRVAGSWRTVIILDTENFNTHLSELEKKFKSLEIPCRKILRNDCEEILNFYGINRRISIIKMQWEQLQETTQELRDQNDDLMQRPMSKSIRKRSVPWFGIVGKMASTVIGVLSYEDGERYERSLLELDEAQRNISKLVGEQTHLVRAELHNLYQAAEQQQKIANNWQERLNNMQTRIQDFGNQMDNINYTVWIQITIRNWEEHLDIYEHALEQTLQVMYSAKEGKLHPRMLTNQQLLRIAKEAQEHLGEFIFPVNLNTVNVATLGKISVVSSRMNNDKLIMTLDIPLLEREKYLLYKMHEVPTLQKHTIHGNRAYISPHARYIATSAAVRKYFYLEEEDLITCSYIEHKYICHPRQVIYDSILIPSCESELLRETNNETLKSCDIRITDNQQPHWSPITTTGSWIYSLTTEETAYLSCYNQPTKVQKLEGVGLLQIASGCRLTTDTIELPALQIKENKQEYLYEPKLELCLEELSPILQQSRREQTPISSEKIRPPWKKMEGDIKLENLEKELKLQSEHRLGQNKQNYYTHSVLGTTTIVILVTIGYIIYRCTIKVRKTKSSTLSSIFQFQRNDDSIIYALPDKTIKNEQLRECRESKQEENLQTTVQIEMTPKPKIRDRIQLPLNSTDVC